MDNKVFKIVFYFRCSYCRHTSSLCTFCLDSVAFWVLTFWSIILSWPRVQSSTQRDLETLMTLELLHFPPHWWSSPHSCWAYNLNTVYFILKFPRCFNVVSVHGFWSCLNQLCANWCIVTAASSRNWSHVLPSFCGFPMHSKEICLKCNLEIKESTGSQFLTKKAM